MQHQQSNLSTKEDGHALAASMLEEIQNLEPDELDELSIEAEYRDGRPQKNVVFKYLKAMKVHGNEAAMAGFAAVLTDFLACPGTDSDLYQRLAQEAQPATV